MSTIHGWAAWKDKSLHHISLSPTKRDMLIGYDMIPLRGLRRCEARLKKLGITVERTSVSRCAAKDRHGFCVLNGMLDAESLGWSINHPGGGVWKFSDPQGHETLTLCSTCSYLLSKLRDKLPERDQLTLGYMGGYPISYDNPAKARDGRQRVKLQRETLAARGILERLGMDIVPVRFEKGWL